MCYWKQKKICLPVVTQIRNYAYFEVACKRRINRERERDREREWERESHSDTFCGILDFQSCLIIKLLYLLYGILFIYNIYSLFMYL